MRPVMTRLQSEKDAVFMVMDKTRAIRNKAKVVVTEVANVNSQDLKLEVELHHSSKHLAPAMERESAVGRISLLSKGRFRQALWNAPIYEGRNDMVSRIQLEETDMNETPYAVSTSLDSVCMQICLCV